MRLQLGVLPVPTVTDPDAVAGLVRLLEELDCESVWAVEHIVVPEAYDSVYPYDAGGTMSLSGADDVPDPLHWLTLAAAYTTRLRLATGMLILPLHHPVMLAKRLATVDVLSRGRLIAGIGVGWLAEEYHALGVPFEGRGARADEYLAALKALWSPSPSTFDGIHTAFTSVHSAPKPYRAGGIPIVVGGHSRAAVRRAARYGNGFYPLGDRRALGILLERLRGECAAIGRDPAEIEVTARAPATRAEATALADLGVRRVVMRIPGHDTARIRDAITRYRNEVLV